MKSIVALISFFLLSSAQSEGIRADRVLEEMQKKYKNSKDFKAQFNQIIRYQGLSRKGISSGSVIFKKPNKIKWIQEKPDKSLYVSNGKTMWLYMIDDQQVFVNNNLQEVIDKIGLLFMSSGEDLVKKYSLSVVQSVLSDQNEGDKKNKKSSELINKDLSTNVSGRELNLEIKPLRDENFTAAYIKIDLKSFLVSRVTILDLAKNKTSISLKNIKFDVGTKDSFFEFKPPKNVEVFSNQF